MSMGRHVKHFWRATSTSRVVYVLLASLSTGFLGCGEDSSSPRTNLVTRTAQLVSPHGAEGAFLVEISGVVGEVEAIEGELFQVAKEDDSRVFVFLDSPGTLRFQVTLPAGNDSPTYTILEVAGPDDELRSDLGSYRLEFLP